MNGTPRMRSSYPATPATHKRPGHGLSTGSPNKSMRASTQPAQTLTNNTFENEPVIPTRWVEAPQQRLYALGIFVLLWFWRLWDFYGLQESEEQSLWLFLKWVSLDGLFLFGLPGLRIPWLEWSQATMLMFFSVSAVINAMFMFQIAVPFGLAAGAVGRSVWGAYEMAINENSVSIQSVLHNESLILGRQIIHILPEGSAILNADRESFCIDSTTTEARIPLTINSTNPIAMDLVRIDLDTQANETIHLGKAQIKAMHKEASRLVSYSEKFHEPKTLYISVKRPGLYHLAKVLDETNLEVSKKYIADTVVVPCPRVTIQSLDKNKCRGELSNINLEVVGTPPLRVKYHKMMNQVMHESVLESVQPEDLVSPLLKQDQQALVLPNRINTEWAKTQIIQVPMSEHLGTTGIWAYTVDEVRDGFGNVVTYTSYDQDKQERQRKAPHLHAVLQVHERPIVSLENGMPLKVALGKTAELPIKLASTGRVPIAGEPYTIEYIFTPKDELSADGDHGSNPQRHRLVLQDGSSRPKVKEAGLYSLIKVSTDYCAGEVLEPATIPLRNPPTPDLAITSQEISDKCAGRPVGLRVDLDMIGTPPFTIRYTVNLRGSRSHETMTERITGHRGQIVLTPSQAGHYTYRFFEMDDAIYRGHSLKEKDFVLEQDVKPSAGASFMSVRGVHNQCIDESVELDIALQGEGPFKVEYELLHGGKRQKFDLVDLPGPRHVFSTPQLRDGGEYTVALRSIIDGTGCKEFLNDEEKIHVRHQKPKAGFGRIDGQAHVDVLEGMQAQLPLRLVGEAPWIVQYRDSDGHERTYKADQANDRITARDAGSYELLGVRDNFCPGLLDEQSTKFSVKWIPRPEMRVAKSNATDRKSSNLLQQAVCEGEESAIDLLFKGAAPFAIGYSQSFKPLHGVKAPVDKQLKGLQSMATIRLDTAQAGTYDYKFTKLEDANYEHNSKHFSPITIQQQVYAKPSAAFASPGRTYSFCSVQSEGEEVIPVQFVGEAPFDLEIEVKHHGGGKPVTLSLTGLTSNHYNIRIPHRSLHLGKSSVALLRIKDSRGCSRILDSSVPRVQIAVYEPPTIHAIDGPSDVCVGEHINFRLSGAAPFTIFYNFESQARKAVEHGGTFKRLAEKPGTFTITGIQDSASSCRGSAEIIKRIHGLPSARVSRGRESYVDIHEGATTEILFEFGGAPPFEFTYQRSANTEKGKRAGAVLDTRSEISYEHSMRVRASEEGTYEVVSIKDQHCSYSRSGLKGNNKGDQKRLTY